MTIQASNYLNNLKQEEYDEEAISTKLTEEEAYAAREMLTTKQMEWVSIERKQELNEAEKREELKK
ncbi:hypothetical protein DAPPUDRAFT_249867 [Daphnia pulex]|uniref:Uncharacterized protein n=1 Tax=Daphnia pulex TaxID=6669 RepID=E9GXE7_DAPPU|nr:hypothetical protein DAPPUDRAFT_249867 [Daphnia pulex]|eukprot:EFX75871.1 hypothetical protein DAPPUDRAFT_249867 [Daphnia pulex]